MLPTAALFPGGVDTGEMVFEQGWRLGGAVNWPEDLHGTLAALSTETGAPTLIALVADGAYAIIAGHTPGQPPGEHDWSGWLDAQTAAGDGMDVDGYDAKVTYECSRRWARAAGLRAHKGALRPALTRQADGNAVGLLRLYLAGLGIPGVPVGDLHGLLDSGALSDGWSVSLDISL